MVAKNTNIELLTSLWCKSPSEMQSLHRSLLTSLNRSLHLYYDFRLDHAAERFLVIQDMSALKASTTVIISTVEHVKVSTESIQHASAISRQSACLPWQDIPAKARELPVSAYPACLYTCVYRESFYGKGEDANFTTRIITLLSKLFICK